jgi:hypothetical protein
MVSETREPDEGSEAQAADPGEIVYAAGKRYRKRADGKLEFIGYQKVVDDDAEHA